MESIFACVEEFKSACYDNNDAWEEFMEVTWEDADDGTRRLGGMHASQEEMTPQEVAGAPSPLEDLMDNEFREHERAPQASYPHAFNEHKADGFKEHKHAPLAGLLDAFNSGGKMKAGPGPRGGMRGGPRLQGDGEQRRAERGTHTSDGSESRGEKSHGVSHAQGDGERHDGESGDHVTEEFHGGENSPHRSRHSRKLIKNAAARKLSNCPNGGWDYLKETLSPQCSDMLFKLADGGQQQGGHPGQPQQGGRWGDDRRNSHDDRNEHHWKGFIDDVHDDYRRHRHHDDDDDEHHFHFPRFILFSLLAYGLYVGCRRYNRYKNDRQVVVNGVLTTTGHAQAQPSQQQQQPFQGVIVAGNGQPQISTAPTGVPILYYPPGPSMTPNDKGVSSTQHMPSF